MRHAIVTLMLLMWIPPPAFAGGGGPSPVNGMTLADSVVTLGEFLNDVRDRNPSVQEARSQTLSVLAQIPQARAWDDPLVGVEFIRAPLMCGGQSNPVLFPQTGTVTIDCSSLIMSRLETDVFLQQMIPFPGKKSAMANAAMAKGRMAGETQRAVLSDVITGARQAYAMLLTAQERLRVNQESETTLGQILDLAQVKYSVGGVTQANVLKVQVEMAKLQNDRIAILQEIGSAQAMMNALRGLPATSPVAKAVLLETKHPGDSLDAYIASASEHRPEIVRMNHEIEMTQWDLTSARRDWLPDFMVRGMYMHMANDDGWALMVGITVPIAPWSAGGHGGKVDENDALHAAAQKSLVRMQTMIEAEVRTVWTRMTVRHEQCERYTNVIIPKAQQSLESALTDYQTAKIDFLSLLDSYRMVQMLRMEYAMTLGNYLDDLALFDRAIGTVD